MNAPSYVDGFLSLIDREVTPIERVPKLPFKNYPTPDRYARLMFRDYLVQPKRFVSLIADRYSWTNLLLRSEELNDAAWTLAAATVSANAGTAPDGTATGDKLVESAANAAHRISQAGTVSAGALTAGVAIKAAGRNRARVSLYNATDGRFAEVSLDLSSAGYKIIAGSVVRVNRLDDGWVYIAFSGTATVANSALYVETEKDDGSASYLGDGASGLLVWRPTLVTGTSAPPLIDTVGATRTVSVPLMDANDPLAFVIEESDPLESEGGEDTAKVQRVFGRLPRTQVRRGTVPYTKPTFPTQDYDGFWVDSLASNVTANIWSVVIAITAEDWKVTGGTFRVRYNVSGWVTLNWNDSAATIQTALNTIVPGGVTVSQTSASQHFTVTRVGSDDMTLTEFDYSLLTGNGGILTASAFPLGTATGTFGYASAHRTYTKTAHGLTVSQSIRLVSGSAGGGTPFSVQSVPTADTFRTANASFFTTATLPLNYRTFLRTYTPGPDVLSARVYEKFYWPGWQIGVATDEDIPNPDVAINDTQFLTGLLAGTPYLTYNFSDVNPWRDTGPIYRVLQTDIKMADA